MVHKNCSKRQINKRLYTLALNLKWLFKICRLEIFNEVKLVKVSSSVRSVCWFFEKTTLDLPFWTLNFGLSFTDWKSLFFISLNSFRLQKFHFKMHESAYKYRAFFQKCARNSFITKCKFLCYLINFLLNFLYYFIKCYFYSYFKCYCNLLNVSKKSGNIFHAALTVLV